VNSLTPAVLSCRAGSQIVSQIMDENEIDHLYPTAILTPPPFIIYSRCSIPTPFPFPYQIILVCVQKEEKKRSRMGVILPKPITSKVVERTGNSHVAAAVCSINGYRTTMEDSHAMILEDRMFFGVFDGHSSDKCSAYIAQHLPGRIMAVPSPIADATYEKICLDLDQEFLDTVGEGGTTATFCLVERIEGKKYHVTVNNVGDSRIIHMRGGEILSVTQDHKPQNPGEKARIERCGGAVRMNRVDGDLAVSRAFGDISFKRNREDPRSQKVIAVPDIFRITCEVDDVLIISCDGVFEGNFPSEEVAQFVYRAIATTPSPVDLGLVAAKVCDQAVRKGSKDNITCMVVRFTDGVDYLNVHGPKSFVPGPPYPKSHDNSRVAYTRMAQMAETTCAQALQRRYKLLQSQQAGTLSKEPLIDQTAFDMSDEVDIEMEKAFFGSGPTPGAEEQWFANLADPYSAK
jgi:protein phosphatase